MKAEKDDSIELNLVTGCFQKRFTHAEKEGLEYDPLTGSYIEKADSDKIIWPSLVGKPIEKSDDGQVEWEAFVPFFIEKADQQIVTGIVYEPDTEDSQGDQASAEEIEKAAHQFMEECQTFKVMHKGSAAKVKVLESYVAPQALTIAGNKIKKGTWILVAKVSDVKIWKAIKDGKLTGFSMAGHARSAA